MRLLDELERYLRRNPPLALDQSGSPADLELQAATALLLLEAAHGDEEYPWSEHRAIVRGLENSFGLRKAEVLRLLARSEEIRPPRVLLADVTDIIRARFDEQQRREIVRLLWQVIRADGVVEPWEESFATHVTEMVGLGGGEN